MTTVPSMPPAVTCNQAKGFAEAFLRGQSREAAVTSTWRRGTIGPLEA